MKVTNVVWLFDFFNDWQFWLFKKKFDQRIVNFNYFKIKKSPTINYGISKTAKSQQSINNHKDDFLKIENKLKITIIGQNQFLFGLIIGF